MAPSILRALAVLRTTILVLAASAAVAFAADRVRRGTPKGQPAPAAFKISGTVDGPLVPGLAQRVRLTLRNPHKWPLLIHRVDFRLTMDRAHARAGCTLKVNYRRLMLPRKIYPLRLPPKSTRTLRQLGVTSTPAILMRNLPVNQDVCQGAQLRLRFSGRSARAGSSLAR